MSIPKQDEILKQLTFELTQGKLGSAGEPFPTVRSLSESFGASPVTIQRVVHRLCDLGLIQRQGRGMKIAPGIHRERRRIGVVVSQMDNPFHSRLLNEFEHVGEKRGIEILSAGCADNSQRSTQIIRMLEENKAEAIVVCANKIDTNINAGKLPVICIGGMTFMQKHPVVGVDSIRAGEIAATHLIAQGCRDFFYVTSENIALDERMLGFTRCLEHHNLKLPKEHILRIDQYKEEPLNETFFEFFKNNISVRPAGVFCFHDLWAMRVLRAAHFLSLNVPNDMAVVGVDNLPICAETFPPLSSIAYPIRKLAESALDILDEIRSGRNVGARRTLLEPQLVVRQSSVIKKG